MEVQDKVLLRSQKKSALQLFEKRMKNEKGKIEDPAVEKTFVEAISLYKTSIKKDKKYLDKSILLEMERLSSMYHSVISLMLALADQASKDKKRQTIQIS